MKGHILDFSAEENTGIISGDDGQRYQFVGAEWKSDIAPSRGLTVDFDTEGNAAKAVYRALGVPRATKNRQLAGWIAILCGYLGIHKFYLGFPKEGWVYLLVSLVGGGILLGIPLFIIWIMAALEGVVYLKSSDEEFEQILREQKEG